MRRMMNRKKKRLQEDEITIKIRENIKHIESQEYEGQQNVIDELKQDKKRDVKE